jgi:hypothetical protein
MPLTLGGDGSFAGEDLTTLGGAWTSWTPSYANLTVGNGSVVAVYSQIGKTVVGSYQFNLGSTSSIGTTPTISAPVPVRFGGLVAGHCRFIDAGTQVYYGLVVLDGPATFYPMSVNVAGTYPTQATLSAAVPHTWAATDVLSFYFMYEAA